MVVCGVSHVKNTQSAHPSHSQVPQHTHPVHLTTLTHIPLTPHTHPTHTKHPPPTPHTHTHLSLTHSMVLRAARAWPPNLTVETLSHHFNRLLDSARDVDIAAVLCMRCVVLGVVVCGGGVVVLWCGVVVLVLCGGGVCFVLCFFVCYMTLNDMYIVYVFIYSLTNTTSPLHTLLHTHTSPHPHRLHTHTQGPCEQCLTAKHGWSILWTYDWQWNDLCGQTRSRHN